MTNKIDITIKNVDINLLREQVTELTYFIHEIAFPIRYDETMEGILNMLETMLDTAEEIITT